MNKSIFIISSVGSWVNQFAQNISQELAKSAIEVTWINEIADVRGVDQVVICLGYQKIIEPEFLSKQKSVIVIHESALPKGKGWAPLTWQVLEGKNKIPISLIECSKSVDSGRILLSSYLYLNGMELIQEIRNKLSDIYIKMISDFCYYIERGMLCPRDQVGQETWYPKRVRADSELNLNKSIDEQFNLLRIVDNENYPAFFIKNGIKYFIRIEKCEIFDE